MPAPTDLLHLAVALDGAGWHPAAWREPDAQPDRLLTPAYWVDLAQRAERGLLDFITIEDGLDPQSDDHFRRDERTDRVRGRLDAVLNDLTQITDALVPELQRRGAFRSAYVRFININRRLIIV